jgi:hypothetical protein
VQLAQRRAQQLLGRGIRFHAGARSRGRCAGFSCRELHVPQVALDVVVDGLLGRWGRIPELREARLRAGPGDRELAVVVRRVVPGTLCRLPGYAA